MSKNWGNQRIPELRLSDMTTRFPPLPDSRDIGICLPVGTFSSPEPSSGLGFLSEGFS